MTAEQFAYWLQGFAELSDAPPTPDQWAMVKDHLALVFQKVTPNRVLGQTVGGGLSAINSPQFLDVGQNNLHRIVPAC